MVALIVLWSIPTLLIALVARLNTLEVFFPFFSFTSNMNRLLLAFVEGMLGLILSSSSITI